MAVPPTDILFVPSETITEMAFSDMENDLENIECDFYSLGGQRLGRAPLRHVAVTPEATPGAVNKTYRFRIPKPSNDFTEFGRRVFTDYADNTEELGVDLGKAVLLWKGEPVAQWPRARFGRMNLGDDWTFSYTIRFNPEHLQPLRRGRVVVASRPGYTKRSQ